MTVAVNEKTSANSISVVVKGSLVPDLLIILKGPKDQQC